MKTTRTKTITAKTCLTRAGKIKAGVFYQIRYRCTTPGPEVEEGIVYGEWNGDIDTWGKLTINADSGPSPLYLFAGEIMEADEATDRVHGALEPNSLLHLLMRALRQLHDSRIKSVNVVTPNPITDQLVVKTDTGRVLVIDEKDVADYANEAKDD